MGKLINTDTLNSRIREWAKKSDTADMNTVLDIFEIIDETEGRTDAGHKVKGKPNKDGLLPCPFCGSSKVEFEDFGDGEDECFMVQCTKCGVGVSGPGGEDGCCDPTREEAAKAWNRRA